MNSRFARSLVIVLTFVVAWSSRRAFAAESIALSVASALACESDADPSPLARVANGADVDDGELDSLAHGEDENEGEADDEVVACLATSVYDASYRGRAMLCNRQGGFSEAPPSQMQQPQAALESADPPPDLCAALDASLGRTRGQTASTGGPASGVERRAGDATAHTHRDRVFAAWLAVPHRVGAGDVPDDGSSRAKARSWRERLRHQRGWRYKLERPPRA